MSCSCNQTPCCCNNPCAPANVIYQSTCADPGSASSLRHLLGLDSQFCQRRLLAGGGGYLVARNTPNGTIIAFTTEPVVALDDVTAVQGATFGQLLIQGSDNVMRTLTGPAVANLVLKTNAAGQFIIDAIPAATVPDPLTIATLNVTGAFTLASGTITGTPTFTGLGTGALSFFVGLDAGGNLIKGTPATTGVQVAMFFESPTSPSAATPNSGAAAGATLTIGNLIFDSVGTPGGALFTPTNSQTLTCLTAGVYTVNFEGQVTYDSGSSGRPAIQLLVNGVIVSYGNGRPLSPVTTTQRSANLAGTYARRFAAGDTIQLQLSSGAGSNTNVYEARVNLTRTGA